MRCVPNFIKHIVKQRLLLWRSCKQRTQQRFQRFPIVVIWRSRKHRHHIQMRFNADLKALLVQGFKQVVKR